MIRQVWVKDGRLRQVAELDERTHTLRMTGELFAHLAAQLGFELESETIESDPVSAVDEAIGVLVEVGFDWAGEYGFSRPAEALKVWNAAALLRPDLEPRAQTETVPEIGDPRR